MFSKLKARHIKFGRKGEKLACKMLKNKGYDILHRNLKLNNIEVDIVARDGAVLCFIEVKSRHYKRKNKTADNTVWVRSRQAERISKAAKEYLYEINGHKLQYRFELIEISISFNLLIKINHWTSDFGKNSSS